MVVCQRRRPKTPTKIQNPKKNSVISHRLHIPPNKIDLLWDSTIIAIYLLTPLQPPRPLLCVLEILALIRFCVAALIKQTGWHLQHLQKHLWLQSLKSSQNQIEKINSVDVAVKVETFFCHLQAFRGLGLYIYLYINGSLPDPLNCALEPFN